MPIILLLFYIIPIGLFFYKKIGKKIRLILLLIPAIVTAIFTIYAVKETNRQSELYKKYPQMNKITFKNSLHDVKDSIIQLQTLMNKLSLQWSNKSISYSLDKYPGSYNYFNFNRVGIDYFDSLLTNNNLHDYTLSESQKIHRGKYNDSDIKPFGTLSFKEIKRFFNLIKYLDNNKLNGASLEDGIISLSYYDSLRISEGVGFRTIVIDTSGYYGPDFFDIIDSKNGLFLLRKR